MTGGLLTYILVAKEMSVEEIYANVTEMLLAGVDTVRLGLLIHCGGKRKELLGVGSSKMFSTRLKKLCYILKEHFYNIRAMLLPRYRVITPHTNNFRRKIKKLKIIHLMGGKSLWKPKL